MKIKHTLISMAVAALLGGAAQAASQADYDKAAAAAQSSLKAAASVGNQWRDSGKLLKKAAKAAKSGDFAKAVKLAQAAEFQGHMAQQQASEQANAGNPSYLY